MKNIFIIGSKGIPSNYGGFETFVEKLTGNRKSNSIRYHISCLSDNNSEFIYNNARCFNIKVPNVGAAKAVCYDILSLKRTIQYIKDNSVENAVVYILACRIGPFIKHYKKKLDKLGIKMYVNPDGHEWKRAKWNKLIKRYWKISEKLMVKNADLLICDSKNIEKYIIEEYREYNPKTIFIAYGSDLSSEKLSMSNSIVQDWYNEKRIVEKEYYLIVGRFVPENNYEIIIKEFMKSDTKKDLVIITNVEKNKFYNKLRVQTGFECDKRIKFVGTVYNQQLLKKIRENAYGYIHGHEVGGTNPSLLEALATTDLNILLDVGFNREVAEDSSYYFVKSEGNLRKIISYLDSISEIDIAQKSKRAKMRIKMNYTWDKIVQEYETLFLKEEL